MAGLSILLLYAPNLPELVRVGVLLPPVGGEEGLGVGLERLVPERQNSN